MQLWLVEGGGARVFEGGMDKYHEHVLSKLKALKAGVSLQQAAAEDSPTADDPAAEGSSLVGDDEASNADSAQTKEPF
jgi:hypothetical protein